MLHLTVRQTVKSQLETVKTELKMFTNERLHTSLKNFIKAIKNAVEEKKSLFFGRN